MDGEAERKPAERQHQAEFGNQDGGECEKDEIRK